MIFSMRISLDREGACNCVWKCKREWLYLPTFIPKIASLSARDDEVWRLREEGRACSCVREILNLYRQTPIGNRSIPRGNFPFPSPFSMDGAQPSWKREGGGKKKCCLPPTFPSITLLKRIRYFVLRWIDFQAFGSSSREKQILRDKLGIASKLSFRIFFFFRFNPCYFVL